MGEKWCGGGTWGEGRSGRVLARGFGGALGGSREDVHGRGSEGGGGRVDFGGRRGNVWGASGSLGNLSWLKVDIMRTSVLIWTWAAVVDWDPAVAIPKLPVWE